ncbi:c-type cytochrome [Marinoscillum furvescens]|uniref:Cytochrome c n=1 Tax=Marinoscillum furvescens DSM 4134 TaxID=1122208 RepID=A0A3D9L5F0_MARFU|nr:cytochrome c [Marinoscillum furvescens]RED99771.1 cytochrome c [Marinoscillum furvescens DSM 4134]
MMKKWTTMLCTVLALMCGAQPADIPDDSLRVIHGQELYQNLCSRCHDVGNQKLGPSLAGVVDRRPVPWLLRFIQNSQQVVDSGDPYARHLFRTYSHMVMPAFDQLSDSATLSILAYLKKESSAAYYDFAEDSAVYYDKALIDKAHDRASKKQAEERDYYGVSDTLTIPRGSAVLLKGKELFNSQCATCHGIHETRKGPALASVTDRRPLPWLLDFIDSPKEVLETGDDYANFLLTSYPFVMPGFEFLTTDDKLAVLSYVRETTGAPSHIAGVNARSGKAADSTPQLQALPEKNLGEGPPPHRPDNQGLWNILGGIIIALMLIVLLVLVLKFIKGKKD